MSYTLKILVDHPNNTFLEDKYNDTKQYQSDIGIDIYQPEDISIEPHSTVLIELGIRAEVIYNLDTENTNLGYLLVPRSSIYKTSIRMANSIGIIDPNYRGIIKVAVDNISDKVQMLKQGERYFQLVFTHFYKPNVVIADSLSNTDRNNSGFGSTS